MLRKLTDEEIGANLIPNDPFFGIPEPLSDYPDSIPCSLQHVKSVKKFANSWHPVTHKKGYFIAYISNGSYVHILSI
jgi:hypothetical protein